jgi:hypothetical protein
LMRNGLLACLTEEATAENDARVAYENNGIDWSARMPALKNFFWSFHGGLSRLHRESPFLLDIVTALDDGLVAIPARVN